ncbi:hypothetical protein [Spongiactinospora sp. TRM90649]|uniref:hypothetical protein n=1 Tax=Spongiactinospora sp. TRM90649 TaxID=3031114 RepID=UPI0023F6A181|nr:hypothetical protein [Spongiactinospora sp. TRM90649]MDF5752814.1 hypothetical protein [Spongiactinospora sp. TRM90649]
MLGIRDAAGDIREMRGDAFVELSAEDQRGNSNPVEPVEDVPLLEGSRHVVVRLTDQHPERDQAHEIRVEAHRRGAHDARAHVLALGDQVIRIVRLSPQLTTVGAVQDITR